MTLVLTGKDLKFGGAKAKNRGQTGSHIFYIHPYLGLFREMI